MFRPQKTAYSRFAVRDRECVLDGYRLWVDGDLLCLRPDGPITLQVVDWLAAASLDILTRHEHYYILGDLLDAGPISPALRRRLAEHGAAYPPRAIAFYHVGIVAQGVNALLFGALNLLSRRKQPMRQFSTEADARRWLDEQRPVKTPDGAR